MEDPVRIACHHHGRFAAVALVAPTLDLIELSFVDVHSTASPYVLRPWKARDVDCDGVGWFTHQPSSPGQLGSLSRGCLAEQQPP